MMMSCFVKFALVLLCTKLIAGDRIFVNVTSHNKIRSDIWTALHNYVTAEHLNDILKKHQNYKNRLPFPHMVESKIFPEDVLRRVGKEIPDQPNAKDGCVEKSNSCFRAAKEKYKNGFENEELFGPATASFFGFLRSSRFIQFLEKLTGINDLIPDPHYFGSGVHQTLPGGHLDIHADFNRYERYNLYRRVNILLYLNPDWKEEYGGHLELWPRDMSKCMARVAPDLGTLAVFSSTDFSYHGHPEALTCPQNRSRRSLALYYYSATRPSNECIQNDCKIEHTTLFQKTPCKCSDTACQNFVKQA